MSVKYRITLLVTAAGFIASMLFSVVIFYELIEQPFYVLDFELAEEATRAVKLIEANQKKSQSETLNPLILDTFPTWLKVYEYNSGRVLWKSKVVDKYVIPTVEPGSAKNADAIIKDDKIDSEKDSSNKAAFRTKTFEHSVGDKKLKVQTALPMIKLKEEMQELITGIIAGLVFSTLVLIFISYFVADKILKPIGTMKELAYRISAENLDQRIPTGKEKDEFNELASTINMMLDRIQFSFTKQRNFLFDTSHELKTPLTTIRLAIDEICSEHMENLTSSSRESLLRVNEQVARMEKLVRDLLNLSSLEILNHIDPKPVNLSETINSMIEDYQFLAAAKNIKIDIDEPGELFIPGDKEKLKRALSNILDNAIKYNFNGGRVEIKIDFSNDEINVTVSNTGLGVSEEEIPKIFDQFYRVEKSRSIHHGGSGLGLAIVKRIIELHGGKVGFKSGKEGRTKITITLPRAPKESTELKNENNEGNQAVNNKKRRSILRCFLS